MKITDCPHCGDKIVECDNNVYLDYPAKPYDERNAAWTIMNMGNLSLASVGNPSMGGTGHSLHIHQPMESVMS